MSKYPSHLEICELLGIEPSQPRPDLHSFACQRTIVEVYANGNRVSVFGGMIECKYCGFGVGIQLSETSVPPIRPDGKCPKCLNTGVKQ